MADTPFIPETIIVHLGAPNADAPNVEVPFIDYIKSVASSEIYPTWPEAAIRANVYAQTSFALNRYFNEFYPSQGFDFDVTNLTQFDQAYNQNGEVFENVSRIVDEIFNDYVVRGQNVEPLLTSYCNGTTTTCNGLSQWGTVSLAEQGLGAFEILQQYYGDDINIVENAPVRLPTESYPGIPLRLGDINDNVREIQVQLNRISRNYPAIPKINPVNGVFNEDTLNAVLEFQRIFNLTPDGVVGKGTWYKLAYIFNGVKRLSELDSEGLSQEEIAKQYQTALTLGDTGDLVRILQYYLEIIAQFDDSLPSVVIDGVFDENTQNAVIALQSKYGLAADGIVGRQTWNQIQRIYRGILDTTTAIEGGVLLYPGVNLTIGSQGENVRVLQEYLAYISGFYPSIPTVPVTGVFGNQTDAAVKAYQSQFGLIPNGVVGPLTWDGIARLYSDLKTGNDKQSAQFVGKDLQEEAQ